MEKYEINKYISSFQKEVSDLYKTLNIKDNSIKLEELEALISKSDFWDDQVKAQGIISESNLIRSNINSYNLINNDLNNLLSLFELSESDDEIAALIDEEILKFSDDLEKLKNLTLLSDKYDNYNAIMEIHPGAGGTESNDWALMLYRMYSRYFAKKGFKVKLLDYQAGEEAGIKSVTISVQGDYAYGHLKAERGVHRLVRISPFDSQSRRHTSFCSCDVVPQIEDNNNDIIIKDEDIRIDVFHSSGAGGQSVNTTDSAVRVTHLPTKIVVSCQNERSQIKNKETCLKILKSKLLELSIRKQEEELQAIKGSQSQNSFGSQIRSYVMHPYSLVKDHRTQFESGNVNSVLDGDIDSFIQAYLKFIKEGN
ncbi:MAG: peptide chain release factor 2 [Anaeroplasmataceae bacterium]